MTVRQAKEKLLEAYRLASEGSWIAAAWIILEVSREFLPATEGFEGGGRMAMAATAADTDDELTADEVKELKATATKFKGLKPPRGSKQAVGGPFATFILTTLGPALFKLLLDKL